MECPLFWLWLFWTLSLKYQGRHIYISPGVWPSIIGKKRILGFRVLKNFELKSWTCGWVRNENSKQWFLLPKIVPLEIVLLGRSSWKKRRLRGIGRKEGLADLIPASSWFRSKWSLCPGEARSGMISHYLAKHLCLRECLDHTHLWFNEF